MSHAPTFAYFGGEPLGVPVLTELKRADLLPTRVVCNPDRPAGRGRQLTAPPVKIWAEAHNIPVFQPDSYVDPAALAPLTNTTWDLFVVVAYNHILPNWLIDLPTYGTLNVHPSLLPKLRGPSPIRSAIRDDRREDIGVTIMQMDEMMDHGPIVAQEEYAIEDGQWPMWGDELDARLGTRGGRLLAETMPRYLSGEIVPIAQAHAEATCTQKLTKAESELPLDPYDLPHGEDAQQTLRKIRAFASWPETFFMHNGKRIKIKDATLAADGSLLPLTIVPEGKQETSFTQYFSSPRT